ncbi:hypothetical protein HOI26_05625 [Candidatus Woesearchaeota archaeon]|jgi:hypothetical protein|nr:hypothetical protein [Candidatus Woesearchaeota archaeon]MBT5740547.1 hypothetical protein [Candidatus Woesearchaeota archaeon]
MDIEKTLAENKTVLIVLPSSDYHDILADVTKKLSKKNVCYVTLNKTFYALTEQFKKKKVKLENMVFIDAISKTIKKSEDQTESCYFVSSPGALTELSIVISKFIGHGFDYLIFDSITNLLTYRKPNVVEKFVCNLINKVKASKTKGIFLALNIKEQEALIKKASMFVDAVIEIK